MLTTFAGDASKAAVSVLVLSVVAFVVGGILDSFRNCRENDEVKWDFFFEEPDEKKVERLNDYYFTYYVLNRNLSSAIVIAWVIFTVRPPAWACWIVWPWNPFSYTQIAWFLLVTGVAVCGFLILRRDSKSLRDEIKKHTNKRPRS